MERKIKINRFDKQHYSTYFDKDSGLLIRKEDKGYDEPFWCEKGPELLDISITNWCDKNCSVCYKKSDTNGIHMKLSDYEQIIKQASEIGVLQVALGGGNPNQHPDFCDILRITNQKYDIIPSYTTNGRGLTDEILEISKKFCGAVAISYYEPQNEFFEHLYRLLSFGIKTNIHFVLTSQSVKTAIKWLEKQPDFLIKINAIIFLNYKDIGVGNNDLLLNKNHNYQQFFSLINTSEFNFKIGFDSCSITGIVDNMNIRDEYLEPCESGRFSAFISEDMKMYPCSFMIEAKQGNCLRTNSIEEIWKYAYDFKEIRRSLKTPTGQCKVCTTYANCLGGCPFLDNINLCSKVNSY